MTVTPARIQKSIRLVALLLLLAFLAWFSDGASTSDTPTAPTPGFIEGRVVAVADGDTVTVLDAYKQQHRIRLVGIDAPESRQAYGQQSTRQLADWVFGKEVRVQHEKTDRYRRVLGVIWLDGQDMNLAMVQVGMAWHYKQYQRDQAPADRQRYAQAEVAARQQRLGLWADAHPTAPWDFRRAQRQRPTPRP